MKIKSLAIVPILVCTAYTCLEISKKIKTVIEKEKTDKKLLWKNIEELYWMHDKNVEKIREEARANDLYFSDLYKQTKYKRPDTTIVRNSVIIRPSEVIRSLPGKVSR